MTWLSTVILRKVPVGLLLLAGSAFFSLDSLAQEGAAASSESSTPILTADADLAVLAELSPILRTIIYAEIPQGKIGGTLIASIPSGEATLHGATVTFTADPAAGWRVSGWNNSSCASGAADETISCQLAAGGNLNVTATFAAPADAGHAAHYSQIPSDGRGGTLTVSGAVSGEFFDAGATVTFLATPAAGWYVEDWNRGDCENVGAAASPGEGKECILTANEDLLVTATFAVARAAVYGEGLSASLAAAGGGTVRSGETFADGTTIAFYAAPPESHKIARWTNNGVEVCAGQNPCFLTADADLDVLAEFSPILRTIIYAEIPQGKIGGTLIASIPSGEATLHGATVTFRADPAAGWRVSGWNASSCASGAADETISCQLAAGGNLNVTVTFAAQEGSAVSSEAPVPRWFCHTRSASSGLSHICNPSCRASPEGEIYRPKSGITGETILNWICPNSEYYNRCEVLQKCLDGEQSGGFIFVPPKTEEECVASGLASSLTCHNNDEKACARQAQEATQAVCNTPISCEAPLVADNTNGVCRCPASTHLEVDGVCTSHDLLPRVTISFQSSSGGTASADYRSGRRIDVMNGGDVPQGVHVIFRARPDNGYYASGWTGDCADETLSFRRFAGRTQTCSRTVTTNFSVGAEFSRRWSVGAVANPASGGTVEFSGEMFYSDWRGDGHVGNGGTLTLLATPTDGFYVSGWSHSNCVSIGDSTRPGEEQKCVLTANSDLLVVADFSAVPLAPEPQSEYTVSYSRVPANGVGGTLTVAGLVSGGAVASGASVTFSAIPAEGFYVFDWSAPDCAEKGEAANPQVEKRCVLTADSELSVTVLFAETVAPEWRDCVRPVSFIFGPFRPDANFICEGICLHPHGNYAPTSAGGGYIFRYECPNTGIDMHCDELRYCMESGLTEEECVAEGEPSSVECHEGPSSCAAEAREMSGAACVPPERITVPRSVPPPPPEPPSRPGIPSAFFSSVADNVVITWEKSVIRFHSGVTVSGYEILRQDNGEGDFVSVGFSEGDLHQYHEDDAPESVTVRYKVRAHSNAGPSPFSDASRPFFVPMGMSPSPPGRPTVILQANDTAFLEWAAPLTLNGAVITVYQVFLETNDSGEFREWGEVKDSPYIDYFPPGGSTLRYKIRAESDHGPSELSEASDAVVTRPAVRYSHSPMDGRGGTLSAAGAPYSGSFVDWGATVTFTAAPASGWRVSGWNDSSCASGMADETISCQLAAGGNLNVTATFAAPADAGHAAHYSQMPSNGRGGTLTVSGAVSGEFFDAGATVTFLALPAAGWYVEDWNRGDCENVGAAASPGEGKECILTANADLLVTAIFAVAWAAVYDEEGLSASLAAAGGGTVRSGDTFADGTTIAFYAAPPESHKIARWTNNGVEVCAGQNPCFLTADADLDVLAEFSPILRTIIYAEIPQDKTGGTLTASIPSGEATLHGATVTFTADPASGWTLSAWEGDAEGSCAAPDLECALPAASDLHATVRFVRDCAAENRRLNADGESCGACSGAYGEELGGSGGLCVDGDTGDFGSIRQDVLCGALLGDLEGGGKACSGVDDNNTFCILDSAGALPCRGLFRHVLRCNAGYNRMALNPFFCGKKCAIAVGRECLAPALIEE